MMMTKVSMFTAKSPMYCPRPQFGDMLRCIKFRYTYWNNSNNTINNYTTNLYLLHASMGMDTTITFRGKTFNLPLQNRSWVDRIPI